MGKEGTRNSLPTRDVPPPKFKLEGDLFYDGAIETYDHMWGGTVINTQIIAWEVRGLELSLLL